MICQTKSDFRKVLIYFSYFQILGQWTILGQAIWTSIYDEKSESKESFIGHAVKTHLSAQENTR